MTQQLNDDKTYVTYDLALCCALLCFGFTLEGLETSDRRKTGFVFDENEKLREAIKQYWNNRMAVNPKDYFNTLKDLKSRIYAKSSI